MLNNLGPAFGEGLLDPVAWDPIAWDPVDWIPYPKDSQSYAKCGADIIYHWTRPRSWPHWAHFYPRVPLHAYTLESLSAPFGGARG